MAPWIMAILAMAQKRAQNEQKDIEQMNQNRAGQMNMLPQQSNRIGSSLSSLSSIYGSFMK